MYFLHSRHKHYIFSCRVLQFPEYLYILFLIFTVMQMNNSDLFPCFIDKTMLKILNNLLKLVKII